MPGAHAGQEEIQTLLWGSLVCSIVLLVLDIAYHTVYLSLTTRSTEAFILLTMT